MAHRSSYYREKTCPGSSCVRMAPAWGTAAPSLLQRFLWGKPLPPCPGQMCPRNAGLKQVPINPQGGACCGTQNPQYRCLQSRSNSPRNPCLLCTRAARGAGLSIAPGEREPQRPKGMREAAQRDARGSSWQQILLRSQAKDRRKRKKRASLTSLLPLAFFL